jgi:hypothetical protein
MIQSAAEIVREYGPFPVSTACTGSRTTVRMSGLPRETNCTPSILRRGKRFTRIGSSAEEEGAGKYGPYAGPGEARPAHMYLWREGSFPARFRRRRPRLRSENIPQCEAFNRQTPSRKFNSAIATGNQSRSLPASRSANCASASSTRSSRWDRWPHVSRILPIAAE